MAQEISSEKKFVRVLLPWLVAAGALVVYLVTLNHWVSINSLFSVAKVSGWTWQPELSGPLYWLITYPFRYLPLKFIPLALNLLSALCAALTLALLARSVALLPHDRTEDQRIREKNPLALLSIRTAWLPPVLAAVVCGFQLTFWEHATAASSEMLDLLLFAYVIRCLLEFRINGKESALLRASLVYGAAMTSNWAMIGFFPLFLVALVWIQGVGFFQARFLGRMFLFGLAGLSLYLLLPLVASLSQGPAVSFWQALKANVVAQKQSLFALPFSKSALLHGFDPFHGDHPLWVLALPSLLPVLVMAIRWPSYFGDPSKLGVSLTTFIFHFVHVVLFGVCAWVALDPEKFSPRNLLPSLSLMTLYYLGALALGYYCGYFLLVFGAKPAGRPRPVAFYQPFLNRFVLLGIWLVALLVPVLLISRNVPRIHFTNGPLLRQYTSLVEENLPSRSSFVLCDDPADLLLVQSALSQDGRSSDCVLLDSEALKWPDYHRFLRKKYPAHWESNPPKERKQLFGAPELIRLVYKLKETNSVYYLHPSFGYYFEIFYPEPHGLVYKLTRFPTNTLVAPSPSTELIAENETFWGQIDAPILQPLAGLIQPAPLARDPSLLDRIAGWARLSKKASSKETILLAKFYSRALNWWGVQLQQHNHLSEAASHFSRAVDLKPDSPAVRGNLPAQINLQFNHNLQTGTKASIQSSKSLEEQFGRYRNFDDILRENGPFDEPTSCFQQGREFARGGNYRQAAQEFARVCELAPDNLASRFMVAYLQTSSLGMPDQALHTIAEIQSHPDLFSLDRTNWNTLTSIAVSAHLAKGDLTNAENMVQTALSKYQDDEEILGTATRLYIQYGFFSNALATVEQQLKIQPENPTFLVNKGYACLQLSAFDDAIATLTRVVDAEAKSLSELYYRALWNRAIAYLRSDKLDEAQSDYEILQRASPTQFQFYFGLGEIAYRKKDTVAAMRYYTLYLANAPTNSSEATNVIAKLDELKRGVAARRTSR